MGEAAIRGDRRREFTTEDTESTEETKDEGKKMRLPPKAVRAGAAEWIKDARFRKRPLQRQNLLRVGRK